MRVLDAFQRGSERVDVGELARRSLLHVATVDQVLPLLTEQDLVAAHDDRTFSLGLRVAIMAARFGALEQLRATARPVLSRLRDDTGETANLVIRDGDHAVYIEQAQSARALRHVGWIGRRIPLEVSASGKAFRDGRRPQTVRDAVEEGVTAIACGVTWLSEHDAAISVTGPTTRLKGDALRAAKQLVVTASSEISQQLGALR
jgi:DNA-binding IclR family transcriptional regulator